MRASREDEDGKGTPVEAESPKIARRRKGDSDRGARQRQKRNEDVGGDRPRVGSLTEQAVSFAHGRRDRAKSQIIMWQ